MINHVLYKKDLAYISEFLKKENFNNRSILITGASGLIGSFIVDVLLYYNITYSKCIDIYCLGRNKKRIYDNLGEYSNYKCIHVIEQDICKEIPIKYNFDYIIHAASNADPINYSLYPVETILTNVLGTKNILEYAKTNKKCRIVFTSTMEVYGTEIEKNRFIESDFGKINFNDIRSGYPESKRVSEILCQSFNQEYNTKSMIVRLGYIYGPTMLMNDSKVVAQFIRNILKNENIILKSSGSQKRSYCYITDTVLGIFYVLFKGEIGEAYNVATEISNISIKEMAERLNKLYGNKIIYENPNDIEKRGFSVPIDNILCEKKLVSLGWNASFTIEKGLERTIKILKESGRIC